MIKIICGITIVLGGLLFILFIGLNIEDTEKIFPQKITSAIHPTHQSKYISIIIYNSEGGVNYKLIANHVDYFKKDNISLFTKPIFTIFDKKNISIWMIKSDLAKLDKKNVLYLYGHVQINNLANTFQIKRIITDNAVLDLRTQDISSEDIVTIYGMGFQSTGMKMRGNLRNKTANLIEKVHTSYDIQNS